MRVRIEQLTKSFDGHVVLDRLTLALPDAHALVLIGPSGGGKSTLLRILGGLELPDGGIVELNGESLRFESDEALRLHRMRTGFVFQSHNLFPHLTALRNITLPLERVHNLLPAEAEAEARALLGRFQLDAHAHKRPAELSGGQKQRVAIARAVAVRPRLLLFDEPTSSLDPEMTAEVLDMIGELRADGRDFILVTHQMGFARRVADQVALLARGRIVASGTAQELLEQPGNREAREFLARALSY